VNQHRWKKLAESPEAVALLLEAKKRLRSAWISDQKDSKGYPIDTSYVLAQIQANLLAPNLRKRVRLQILKEPTTLAELIPEKLIKAIWEDHHSGTYRDALRKAALFDFREHDMSWKIFQSIVRAMETAYLVNFFGHELLPKPKVNILHRGLSQIASMIGLKGQTVEGFAEFIDDLCPCGRGHNKEAIRKLWSRTPRIRLS
jgi:hypothetical protein